MRIREFSSVPIILLTAKAEDTDKLLGFEYGADDYITNPNILELKARIRAAAPQLTDKLRHSHQLRSGNIVLTLRRGPCTVTENRLSLQRRI